MSSVVWFVVVKLPFIQPNEFRRISRLERIMFDRNHFVVSAIHVNPLTIIWLDQIHRYNGSFAAIPSKPDPI